MSRISVKEKPCKGQGRAYGVKGCGNITKYRRYGLCHSCLADFFLNNDKGKVILEKATLKATKTSRELQKEKENRKNRKTHGELIQETQRLVNKYVRLRDKGKPCISSGIPWMKSFQAGHFYPVSRYGGLRFNLDNIHGQSVLDNSYKDGNELDYGLRLPERIGQERFNALVKAAEDYKKYGKRFSREDLLEIQLDIKQRIKNLKDEEDCKN